MMLHKDLQCLDCISPRVSWDLRSCSNHYLLIWFRFLNVSSWHSDWYNQTLAHPSIPRFSSPLLLTHIHLCLCVCSCCCSCWPVTLWKDNSNLLSRQPDSPRFRSVTHPTAPYTDMCINCIYQSMKIHFMPTNIYREAKKQVVCLATCCHLLIHHCDLFF